MGLRFASSRHPNVVVMAPALTEAGQSQNFKLPASSHSLPASPVGVTLSGLLSNGHLLCKGGQISLGTKLNERSKFEQQYLNFIAKDLIKERLIQTESDSLAFDNLTTLAIASAKCSEGLHSTGGKSGASESGSVKEGGFMMNNCDPSMGDQEDNMGLQKSNTPVPSLESGNFLKEKSLSSDMDQLFKNLGAAISSSDLGGSGDLGQNVEELLQVIKSMESNATESDVPLHGETVGMDPSESGEPEGMFPISDGTDIASGLSTFERELLNDVDMMNMCVDVNLGENPLVIENKEALTKERIEEARKKQFEMERKCEWLLRRLRKLQARTMGKHVSEEVTGLLEQAHRMLKQTSNSGAVGVSVQGEETSATKSEVSRKEKKLKGISAYAMANLFRRLDMLSQQQAAVSTRHQALQRYFGSGSSDHAPPTTSSNGPRVLPKFSAEVKDELEKVSGQLHTQLKMVENCVDSDATASSSGGESCDEMQSFNNHHQMHISIAKRAAWKWAQDRAGVASRWTWLQAQISDLEYRIRQHNEIHRQIRAAKGPVTLAEQQVSATAMPRNNHLVVNGFHGLLPGGGAPGKPASGAEEVVNGNLPSGCGPTHCARTRPLVRSTFRKRKLLQTSGLHLVSKKAARASTIRCGCRPPLPTCALCTGRADPTAPQQPDLLTAPERIALLSPTFHPVLSFPEEVYESTHYDAIMRTPEWQQKALRSSLKSLKSSGLSKVDKESGLERRSKKQQVEHRKKYTSRLKKTVANSLTAKIKRKLTKGRKPKGHDPSNHSLQRLRKKRQAVKPVMGSFPTQCGEDGEEHLGVETTLPSGSSKNTSPVPSPCPMVMALGSERLSSGKERGEVIRRKRENSYDIDNIVIPYSIAASTRVEKLQYKEIPTPKWRSVQLEAETLKLELKNNGVVRRSSQESDIQCHLTTCWIFMGRLEDHP
ncbi:KAT8 regulatory NSL complex subunit 1 isoform X2 [Periplaneta americana]|uniref:KAT8 regulatory NSL complex subunit 1 isoform X2 n=1 Tax=Periplaneta americana TaxID=6978 RepID=UPI0037E97843